MVSYLKIVEGWRDQCEERMRLAGECTPLYDMLAGHLKMYEDLLVNMRKVHEPKQKSLLPREPGAGPEENL